MSTQYSPPQVILDLSPAHPSTARLLADITATHEKGESGIYLVQTAFASGKSTKFVGLLAKLGKVLVLHSNYAAIPFAHRYMSKSFEDGKLEPWVAMKTGGRSMGRQEKIEGDMSKAVIVYMNAEMICPRGAVDKAETVEKFEQALEGATTLFFNDTHYRDLDTELLCFSLTDLISQMTRLLQVVMMSATLDIDNFESVYPNSKTYNMPGFTPF